MKEIQRRKCAEMAAGGLAGGSVEEYRTKSAEALKRETGAFTGIAEYKAVYRAIFNFHAAHNPPCVDLAYWQTHTPGVDDTPPAELAYWVQAAKDAGEVCNRFPGNPFVMGLLAEVYSELERVYNEGRLLVTAEKQQRA